MTHRILLVLTALLLSLFLFACSTVGDSPEAPNIPDVPDEQPNNPAASEEENSPAEEDMAKTNEFAYETEPLPEDLELLHCVGGYLTCTSLSELNQQIRAIQALDSSDDRAASYQTAKIDEITSYYVPIVQLPKELQTFELEYIELRPALFKYYYMYDIYSLDYLLISIARDPYEDPLADIEQRHQVFRDENGYAYSKQVNSVWFVVDSHYLVAIHFPESWRTDLGLSHVDVANMVTIRTVTVKADQDEHNEETDTAEEELQYCGPMPGVFESVQEMHAALRLGWTIDESNEMYSDFSVNNLLDIPYYYVPADIDGFFLYEITSGQSGYTYHYYSNDTSDPEIIPEKARISVHVAWDPVIGEDDALTSIEQSTLDHYKRDENGYIYDRIRKRIYSQTECHLIRVWLTTFDSEMEAQYNTYEVMTSICESVRKVTINPDHVTE